MFKSLLLVLISTFAVPAHSMNNCRIALGSGGFSGSQEGLDYLAAGMSEFLGPIKNVLVIGYASKDPTAPIKAIQSKKLLEGRNVQSITDFQDPRAAILNAEAIVVFGGNTYLLLTRLYENNLLQPIREAVARGVPYIGISAGTNVAAPTILTTNDWQVRVPPSPNSLGIVPFQINPHFVDGKTYTLEDGVYVPYAGETRNDRIAEYHQWNDTDVVAIPEVTFLKVEQGKIVYQSQGKKPLKLFQKDRETREFAPGSDLTSILFPR
jgi:dipeptidase E